MDTDNPYRHKKKWGDRDGGKTTYGNMPAAKAGERKQKMHRADRGGLHAVGRYDEGRKGQTAPQNVGAVEPGPVDCISPAPGGMGKSIEVEPA